ncbi:LacI family DNA-binding transcriptional regulator [Streptomyces sp.]|uniref:LacI family DNA-binding transcriptional regulator n=1 Tax=Streptomyces sp. TaxID=1931 RepID=UPI002D789772|nr:LacI family DNA-binding transcriptional regulator [Streptomyces sp.]HET6355212.1 LacI family DNA-binding transcriptional regulator [Streptomyces sp.]
MESGQWPGGPPTIIDVARVAKVSRQTVSNALNAPEKLLPETLARVLAVIEELGYQPNRMARSMRTHSTRQIGYRLDPDRSNTASVLQDRFLHALTTAAESAGYLLLLFSAGETRGELTRYADMLRTGSVDGFVLSGIDPGDPRPAWLAQRNASFVCFGSPDTDSTDCLSVDVDGAFGTEVAVDHLVAAGHRNIAFLGWPETSGPGEARLHGWQRAMREHGLTPDRCVRALDTLPDSTRAALDLLERAPTPTAVVAASDTFALGCYAAARQRGLDIGRDLAVVGFDDSPMASLVAPALTTVRQPLEEVGETVIRMLTAELGNQPVTDRHILLKPTLVRRDSA